MSHTKRITRHILFVCIVCSLMMFAQLQTLYRTSSKEKNWSCHLKLESTKLTCLQTQPMKRDMFTFHSKLSEECKWKLEKYFFDTQPREISCETWESDQISRKIFRLAIYTPYKEYYNPIL